jgi:hypothetical protein
MRNIVEKRRGGSKDKQNNMFTSQQFTANETLISSCSVICPTISTLKTGHGKGTSVNYVLSIVNQCTRQLSWFWFMTPPLLRRASKYCDLRHPLHFLFPFFHTLFLSINCLFNLPHIQKMSSSLEQLKASGTVVVCDSGKLEIIACIENSLTLNF